MAKLFDSIKSVFSNKKNNKDKNKSTKKNYQTLFIIILIILVVGLWLGNLCLFINKDPMERGTFGDMFGGVNSLFSGLAFLGIILTIFLQSKELSLQREELRFTRKELERTASAQEKSEIALRRQAENLKISAELSALNTLINHYSEEQKRLSSHPSKVPYKNYKERKKECIRKVEEILEMKEGIE